MDENVTHAHQEGTSPTGEVAAKHRRWKLGAMAVATLLVVGGTSGLFYLLSRRGGVVVLVRGPSDTPVDIVTVSIDGQRRCDTSVCAVADLSAGKHVVSVVAPGYARLQPQVVAIKGGETMRLPLQLVAGVASTELYVTTESTGLQLWLDGKERGELPLYLRDIEPGEHRIRVAGDDAFEAYEERITIGLGETKSIGPLELEVVRGLATIEPGKFSDGARVWLVSEQERRPLPVLPIKLQVTNNNKYRIVATKKGYQDLNIPISFIPGHASVTIPIDMRRAE